MYLFAALHAITKKCNIGIKKNQHQSTQIDFSNHYFLSDLLTSTRTFWKAICSFYSINMLPYQVLSLVILPMNQFQYTATCPLRTCLIDRSWLKWSYSSTIIQWHMLGFYSFWSQGLTIFSLKITVFCSPDFFLVIFLQVHKNSISFQILEKRILKIKKLPTSNAVS